MSTLPPNIQRVCSRCGEPVKVYDYASCPIHGRIFNPLHVITRAEWLMLEATIARHPAGNGL